MNRKGDSVTQQPWRICAFPGKIVINVFCNLKTPFKRGQIQWEESMSRLLKQWLFDAVREGTAMDFFLFCYWFLRQGLTI